MKGKKEFEDLCRMLLDDSGSNRPLPEIPVRMQNKFYECFGMAAEDIQEEFSQYKQHE